MRLDGRQRSQGMGLVSAIFLITVVAALSVAILRTVRADADANVQDILSQRAFLAAESGAQLGANRVLPPLGTGSCSAQTFDLGNLGLRGCVASLRCQADTIDSQTLYTLESSRRCESGGAIAERHVLVRLAP